MFINNYNELEKIKVINNLFKTKNYKSKIGSKNNPESIIQNLFYYNPINSTEEYKINILSAHEIEASIPIKDSNFLYKTKFKNLHDLYNYLILHI